MLEFALIKKAPSQPAVTPPHETGPTPQSLALCSTAAARAVLDFESAKKLCALPLGIHEQGEERTLTVAVSAPVSADTVHALRFSTDCRVVVEKAPRELLESAISIAYRGHAETLRNAVQCAAATEHPSAFVREATDLTGKPVPDLLSTILERALLLAASDVHIEPAAEGVRLRYRVNGLLREEHGLRLDRVLAEQVVRRIKVVASMDTTRQHEPQDGGFSFPHAPRNIRIRVSTVPHAGAESPGAEKAVLRLLYNPLLDALATASEVNPFPLLGLSPMQEQILRLQLAGDRGLILTAGPTGSGKSTLLYVLLQQLNRETANVVSIEDPVERRIPGVTQIEVSPRPGMGFSDLLARILRQDPNVVMVGEIRDEVTASTALTAAITGTLVLSTVHAGSCLEVLPRLLELGVSPALLVCSLRLVVAQRLLGTNCSGCICRAEVTPVLQRLFRIPKDAPVMRARGCAECGGTGVGGRTGVFELLPLTPGLRKLVQEYADGAQHKSPHEKDGRRGMLPPLDELISSLREESYPPLADAVRARLLDGTVSPVSSLRCLGVCPTFAGY